MKQLFFFLVVAILVTACSQKKQGNEASTSTQETAPAPAEEASLPSLPLEMVQKLFNECTYVDYIFYELPMSMSLNEKGSIQKSLRHISDAPAPLKKACKAIGRLTYQINGVIFLEADFYYSQGCTYFVFYKDKVKAYSNYMTQEGANSFGNLIQQGFQMQQQAAQGAN